MKLRIRHTTRYTYSEPLRQSVQSLHLWPMSGPTQVVHNWSLRSPAALHARTDALGNRVHHGGVVPLPDAPEVCALDVEALGEVETLGVAQWCDGEAACHPGLFLRSTPVAEPHARMARWAQEVLGSTHPVAQTGAVLDLACAVAAQVRYRKGRTDVETTALEAFDWGLGVCQDQAHVMVAVCRSLGWPARYVSGYFHAQAEPDLASHAWAEVCTSPESRQWLAVDVTHGCACDERHVRLAVGLDYSTCAPVKGVRQGGGVEHMAVDVHIEPVA
jgi:transglutaminase-like putative cysteine protease